MARGGRGGRHVEPDVWDEARARLRVVKPVDVDDPMVRRRRDVVERHEDRLKEEGP